MTQIQIIGAIMYFSGKRVNEIAKEEGISRYSFHRTIKGETKGEKPRAIISKIIGRPESEIWPEQAEVGKEG